uniref:Sphingomyelin phosphodiesterase acid like 3A n=1 Tax=Salmo trutta TaxID=8032 RepID=A0A673YBW6_SALTR
PSCLSLQYLCCSSLCVGGLGSVWRFRHIFDLHFDPTYHVTDEYTKVCFSSKGVPASNPGLFGNFIQVAPQPEFMIWTRDSPPHVPSGELSTDVVIQVISNMTQTIREFLLDMPVYPALGNHDYWPQDQLLTSTNDIYQAAAKLNTTAVRELYSERLVKIIRNYREIISGYFYGHTHRDSVMVLQDQQGEPVNSLFVTPAVTPIKSVLSQIKVLAFHAFEIVFFLSLKDIWQYYLNLIEANQEKRSDWKLEYVITEPFGLKDIQPHSLLQLALKVFCHFMVSYDDNIVCDGACKLTQVFASRRTICPCLLDLGTKSFHSYALNWV